ncbi:MAG: outer membrane beta-barrel protein [Bacteroidota bacterium]
MKHVILTAFLISLTTSVFAQEAPEKKGFITISIGPAFPIGDFASTSTADPTSGFADTGVHINLINFGYLFSENVGITALLSGSAHPFAVQTVNDPLWSYGNLMVGPLLSFPSKKRDMNFDLRVMFGTMSATLDPDDGTSDIDGDGFAFSLGGGVRYHLSRTLSLSGNLDLISSEPEFDVNGTEQTQQIGALSLSVGISFRL